jgi:hypothetical protein
MFSGTVDTGSGYFGCGVWNVTGTRNGKSIDYTAVNPTPGRCAASATFSGAYMDCNKANGSWTNSDGSNGSWSWTRTNTVGAQAVSRGPDAGPPAWARRSAPATPGEASLRGLFRGHVHR